jgi:hypothetical protein
LAAGRCRSCAFDIDDSSCTCFRRVFVSSDNDWRRSIGGLLAPSSFLMTQAYSQHRRQVAILQWTRVSQDLAIAPLKFFCRWLQNCLCALIGSLPFLEGLQLEHTHVHIFDTRRTVSNPSSVAPVRVRPRLIQAQCGLQPPNGKFLQCDSTMLLASRTRVTVTPSRLTCLGNTDDLLAVSLRLTPSP